MNSESSSICAEGELVNRNCMKEGARLFEMKRRARLCRSCMKEGARLFEKRWRARQCEQ